MHSHDKSTQLHRTLWATRKKSKKPYILEKLYLTALENLHQNCPRMQISMVLIQLDFNMISNQVF